MLSEPLILDRRSWLERRLDDRWRAWRTSQSAWVHRLDAIVGIPRRALMNRRVASRLPPPSDRLVVSVGNLRVGGTGKTPVVIDLAGTLARRGIAGAILTRGYGSRLSGPRVVEAADIDGADEARLMAREQPWPVIQAADRLAGLALARRRTRAGEVILLEDAYQSARLGRHHDLLLLDAWSEVNRHVTAVSGACLPWGPYREEAAAASRADAWILTVAEPNGYEDLVAEVPLLLMGRRSLVPAYASAETGPYGIISGIARPEHFEGACMREMGRPPAVCARFPDHARFGRRAVADVNRIGRQRGVACWLTTAKDHAKLLPLWPQTVSLVEVGLALNWRGRTPADLVADWLVDRG